MFSFSSIPLSMLPVRINLFQSLSNNCSTESFIEGSEQGSTWNVILEFTLAFAKYLGAIDVLIPHFVPSGSLEIKLPSETYWLMIPALMLALATEL